MPMFSIIIPCFNAKDTIEGTLASIQAQTFTDWEAICVDDGSTDQTRALIKIASLRDPRIKLHSNPRMGPSAARNYGALAVARAPILAFCDADDLWVPEKLAQLATAFEDQTVDGVFGQIAFFSEAPMDADVLSNVPSSHLSVDMLLGENPVCTMSNMAVRRASFAVTGGFKETMVHNEDLDWLIRLVGYGARVMGLPVLQTFYRRSSGGLSADLDAMIKGRKRALTSAARLGFFPSSSADAIYCRYLARRALRLGLDRKTALRHAWAGLAQSPSGFFNPLRRGVLTLMGACFAVVLPPKFSRTLFS